MRIALFGATGTIGRRILDEALRRGHEVTAIVRDPSQVTETNPKLRVVTGDILDSESVAAAVAGHDAVISAYGPGMNRSPDVLVEATRSLIDGLLTADVARLVMVGGAGSLEVAPGIELIDTPEFPEALLPIARAHSDALAVLNAEASELEWTNLSPAALIEPGARTGTFRTGFDRLIVDEHGESRISAEDYAIAILDEVEEPRHIRERFTVGY
jgi:putative NADH-flavin reductase